MSIKYFVKIFFFFKFFFQVRKSINTLFNNLDKLNTVLKDFDPEAPASNYRFLDIRIQNNFIFMKFCKKKKKKKKKAVNLKINGNDYKITFEDLKNND
jgi:transposase